MRGVLEAVGGAHDGRMWIRRGASPRSAAAGCSVAVAGTRARPQRASPGRTPRQPACARHARAPGPAPRDAACRPSRPRVGGPGGRRPRLPRHAAAGGSSRPGRPLEHLASSFWRAGVTVRSDGAACLLGLRGIGSGSALSAVAPAAPRGHGNRVVFSAPGPQRVVRQRPARPRAGLHDRPTTRGWRGRPADARAEPLQQRASSARPRSKELHRRRPGPHALTYTGLTADGRPRTGAPQPPADQWRRA